MLKALVLTSNSSRHIYFANMVSKIFDVVGVISEPKNDHFREQKEADMLIKHFNNLKLYENRYFGSYKNFPAVPLLQINKTEINSKFALDWAKDKGADVVCLFGTSILSHFWLDNFKERIINLHLGYSPRYRGSATLFWPFFNDELNYIGATIHLAEDRVDAGKIIQIITPTILRGDNYYDITCKTIKQSIDSFSTISLGFLEGRIEAVQQKKEDQKYLYKKKDFSEFALKKVMDLYGG